MKSNCTQSTGSRDEINREGDSRQRGEESFSALGMAVAGRWSEEGGDRGDCCVHAPSSLLQFAPRRTHNTHHVSPALRKRIPRARPDSRFRHPITPNLHASIQPQPLGFVVLRFYQPKTRMRMGLLTLGLIIQKLQT